METLSTTQQTVLEAAANRDNGSIHPLPSHLKGGSGKKVIKALHNQGLIDEIETDIWRINLAGYQAIGMQAPQEIEENGDVANAGIEAKETNSDDEPEVATDETESTDSDVEPETNTDFEDDVAAAEQSMGTANDEIPEIIEAFAKQYVQEHGFRVIIENLEKTLLEVYKAGQASKRKPATKATQRAPRENTKKAIVMAMLRRPEGATLEQISEATGWNANTTRGFLSLAKKKQGLNLETFRTRMVGPNRQGSPGSYSTYRLAQAGTTV
ncbi:MAG: DUF3489 domain-containing protein [Magnetococcales bacterium]|nr:DUF3489 domain-containing protein [Magnetococcales bacterium]MBF0116901.1 DUF3489 domain-containing protein [Magnetococcales bacterium]